MIHKQDSMLPKNLVFVDTETTGFRATRDRIIEIGILRVENGEIVKTYQTLLNPQCYLPQDIEYLTGITKNDLILAPTFSQVKDEIYELLKDAVFVAHNVRFDYSFLKNEFKGVGIKFNPKQLCTVKLSRKLFPGDRRHNLDSLIERLGITVEKRHRAYDDAEVLWKFYQFVTTSFSVEIIDQVLSQVSRKPSVPIGLAMEDIEELPESPGVYLFYGDEDVPLYIGKSVNIRDRVLSHFSADHSSGLEMKISQQIKRIKTIETSGELGALLKEATLIKQLVPLYNKKLRYARKLLCLMKKETKGGYFSIDLETVEGFTKETIKNVLSFAKSKKQAREYLLQLAKEHELCNHLLGVEKTLSECFAYRLGRCKGACKGLENPIFYNTRFMQAFAKTKIRTWPYSGPIMILEKSEDTGGSEAFFINDWCFLGSTSVSEDSESQNVPPDMVFTEQTDINFDLDTYKIINSYIGKPQNQKHISVLNKTNYAYFFPSTV